mmetsp:Transcript_80823/g.210870  ORF Transcript_80823/g.210870 Transcript_80823/m.210870 type:complete len:225 (-) Transcript_80823:105-779(-)
MSFLGCHSGLFSSAARSGAAAGRAEKQQEPAAAELEQPLTGQGPAAVDELSGRSPDEGAPVRAYATRGVAWRCLPAARREEWRDAALLADEPELPLPAGGPEEPPARPADEAAAEEQIPEEPEPAAPAHFDASDREDGGRAAKGCCVPRASRRRAKGTRAAKPAADAVAPAADAVVTPAADAVNADELEATPAADAAKADGIPEAKQQDTGAGKSGRSRASAGA